MEQPLANLRQIEAAVSQGQLRQQSPPFLDDVFDYRVETQDGSARVHLDGNEIELAVTTQDGQQGWCSTSEGSLHSFSWAWVGNYLELWMDGNVFTFERVERSRRSDREASVGSSDILALMPGTVTQIMVMPGDSVNRGQTVIIMESMKMELTVTAHRDGVVKRVAVAQDDRVDKGMRLLELEEQSDTSG